MAVGHMVRNVDSSTTPRRFKSDGRGIEKVADPFGEREELPSKIRDEESTRGSLRKERLNC